MWERERGYTPIEVEEERQEVEAELHKALLLVSGKRAEDFGSVVHVVLVSYPVSRYINAMNRQGTRRYTCWHYRAREGD